MRRVVLIDVLIILERDILRNIRNSVFSWLIGTCSLIGTRPSEANDASFSDFFIFHFLATFSFFNTLLVPPSSRPSFLFFPRPALSKSFRIRKSPFFSDFDESITDRPTNQPTDKTSCSDADASKKEDCSRDPRHCPGKCPAGSVARVDQRRWRRRRRLSHFRLRCFGEDRHSQAQRRRVEERTRRGNKVRVTVSGL